MIILTNDNKCTALTVYVPPTNNRFKHFKTRMCEKANALFIYSRGTLILFYLEFLLFYFFGSNLLQNSYSFEYWFFHAKIQLFYTSTFVLLLVAVLSFTVYGRFLSCVLNALFSLYSGAFFGVLIYRTNFDFQFLLYIFLFVILVLDQVIFFSITYKFHKILFASKNSKHFKLVFSHLLVSAALIYIYSTILQYIINYLMLG